MNASVAYSRYYGNNSGVSTIGNAILGSIAYLTPLCGGYLFFYSSSRNKRMICFLSLTPCIFNMLFANTKSGVIDSFILFFIGLILSYMCIYDKQFKLKKKYIIIVLVVTILILMILFFSMCARIGSFNERTIQIVRKRFGVYAFGSVQAFDFWFTSVVPTLNISDLNLGINTFMAPFDVLGIYERIQGVYDNMQGSLSNIFTGFRGLICDFGMIGSMIFVFIMGIINGKVTSSIKINPRNILTRTVFVCIAFTVFRFCLISPWVYTSFWLMIIEFVAFLYIIRPPKEKCK